MLYEATQLTEDSLWKHTVHHMDHQHAQTLLLLPRYRCVIHRVTILQALWNSQLFSQFFYSTPTTSPSCGYPRLIKQYNLHAHILVIIIHTFLYRRKVVPSGVVAQQVRSRQSLSVITSQVKQVSFKNRFKNCHWGTVKHCLRKWVQDSRCRVTEASWCKVHSPGRLCQQQSSRRAMVPHMTLLNPSNSITQTKLAMHRFS